MKKDRPGHAAARDRAGRRTGKRWRSCVFAETSTLGLRMYQAERRVQARRIGRSRNAARHGADEGFRAKATSRRSTRTAAAWRSKRGVPLKQILAEANFAYLNKIEMKYYLTTPHLLRQRRAAHRARLHHHRGGHDPPLQTHAGLRCRADHRHRRARAEGGARGRSARARRPKEFTRRASPPSSASNGKSSGSKVDRFQRTTEPAARTRSCRGCSSAA